MLKLALPRLRILALLVFAAIMFVAILPNPTAHANSLNTSDANVQIGHNVGLKLDCVRMSQSARTYAVQHGFCSGATPDNTVSGSCGTSSLFMKALGRGNVAFNESANSSLGTIVHVDYTVSWQNQSRNTFTSFGGSQWTFTSSWSNRDTRNTNTGNIYAYVADLTVVLVWGGSCTGLQPWDRIYAS